MNGPEVTKGLLLQSLTAAAIASGPALHAQILVALINTGAAAGDLVLAARCLGALDTLNAPAGLATTGASGASGASASPAIAPDLERTLHGPAYTTFVNEGRTGGIGLITALYPR